MSAEEDNHTLLKRYRKLSSDSSEGEISFCDTSSPKRSEKSNNFEKVRAIFSPSRNKVSICGEEAQTMHDQRSQSTGNDDQKCDNHDELDQNNSESGQFEHVNKKEQRKKKKPTVKPPTKTLHDYGVTVNDKCNTNSQGILTQQEAPTEDQSPHPIGPKRIDESLTSPESSLLSVIADNMGTVSYEDFKRTIPEKENQLQVGEETTPMETNVCDENTSSAEKPNSISIEMVWQMFKEIKDCRGPNIDPQKLKEDCKQIAAETVTSEMAKYKIDKLTKEVLHYRHKTDVLVDVCNSMATEISDLHSRIENIELNNTKNSLSPG